jgi:flagellar motor switch protein FliM
VVALAGFKPVTITDGTANLSITVALASSDVTPVRDQILLITNNNITVSMVDTFGTGTSTTGSTSSATSGATSGGTSGSGGSGSSY